MNNEDMHQISSANMDAIFNGMVTGQKMTQDAFQNTMSSMNSNPFVANDGPRRTDGYFQPQMPQQNMYGGGYAQPQQPQTYGYGYTENQYPYNNAFNNVGNPNQIQAYYGFYNPAYGK